MEVRGNVFCFVGTFAMDTRPMRRRIEAAGGRIVDFEDPEVRVVVLGENVKRQRKAATKRKLYVTTWVPFVAAVKETAPPEPEPARAEKPAGPTIPHELTNALDEVDPGDGEAIHAIVSAAMDNDVNVDLVREGSEPVSQVPAWLLAWCSDADGCEIFVIPAAELDDTRRSDLLAVRGLCFADSRDTVPDRLGAAIRVLAGFTELCDRQPDALAEELFLGWKMELAGIEDDAGIHSAAELRPHIGWLCPYRVRSLADLCRGFECVVAVNLAM